VSRRYILTGCVAVLLGLIGMVFVISYDGRSKTERVTDCLVAAGYDIQVFHDDGKEALGGDEGLLGPLGDYQARPPSDTVTVTRRYRQELATITVQSDAARVGLTGSGAKQARSIERCAG
jgi:hypothetical protein